MIFYEVKNMQASMLLKKKVVSNQNLVLAMDFEGAAYTDSVKTSRTFSTTGSGGTLALAGLAKNGTQSLYQSQVVSGTSAFLATPLSSDLIFSGDFWMESWGYCLGQGNVTFSGGFNTLLSYGAFNATGGLWRWHLDNLKLALRVPSGATDTAYLTSSIAVANGAWNHFAMGRSGNTTSLWVNGALGASSTTALGTIGFGTSLNIAGYFDGRVSGGSTYAGFNGYMDRLRIYSYCKYTAPFTPETGLYPN
jgi:hypothetical protein